MHFLRRGQVAHPPERLLRGAELLGRAAVVAGADEQFGIGERRAGRAGDHRAGQYAVLAKAELGRGRAIDAVQAGAVGGGRAGQVGAVGVAEKDTAARARVQLEPLVGANKNTHRITGVREVRQLVGAAAHVRSGRDRGMGREDEARLDHIVGAVEGNAAVGNEGRGTRRRAEAALLQGGQHLPAVLRCQKSHVVDRGVWVQARTERLQEARDGDALALRDGPPIGHDGPHPLAGGGVDGLAQQSLEDGGNQHLRQSA